MSVRPFDWRDLPALRRCKSQSVFLHSSLVLTRGPLLVPGALFSYLVPAAGVFTCVREGEKDDDNPETLIGQFIHISGSQFARLTFLTPDSALRSAAVASLLEYMAKLCGERAAFRMLADVDEQTAAFDALRRGGFGIFARQRVWRIGELPSGEDKENAWRSARSQDVVPIRLLYNSLVPGMVQQVEPFESEHPRGVVHYQKGELLAYVEFKYGHRGIWVQPFVHPDAEHIPERFFDLLHKIPNRLSRPIYICIRSYQTWLETTIKEIGAEPGPRQAVMVKHLTAPMKAVRAFALPALEGGQPEVTAPIVRTESKQVNGTT